MPGTILGNSNDKKLSDLVTILLACQVAFFLIGLIFSSQATSQPFLATVCVDDNPSADSINRWFTRSCPWTVDLTQEKATVGLDAKNLVFVIQMSLHDMDFSHWQQNLVGVLQVDMVYQEDQKIDPRIELTLDARLAYSDKTKSGQLPWQYFAHAEAKRYMDCSFEDTTIKDKEGYPYNCTMVPFFELASIHHDYYLLNLRLPYNFTTKKNIGLGKIENIYMYMIDMNEGFARIWVVLKTFFFPVIIGITVWFWRRFRMLNRTPALLEYMMFYFGGAFACLNLPVEYLSLIFNMPYTLLPSDVRQAIFYMMILSFLLVLAGENMPSQANGKKNSLKMFWIYLSIIVIGCLCVYMFDLFEQGIQLVNPFYFTWVTPVGTNLVLSFMLVANISSSLYFLCYWSWRVFNNISIKHAILPSISQAKHLHCEGIHWFNFLMLTIVVCGAIRVISFIVWQVAERRSKWNENMELELSSALHTGVYGMWNVYVCAMMVLYAPSHKQCPSDALRRDGEKV